MAEKVDHFATLGIERTASKGDAFLAYRRLASAARRGKDQESKDHAAQLDTAWEVMKDDAKRQAHAEELNKGGGK
jgi:DnaJ-class molecular chaperone